MIKLQRKRVIKILGIACLILQILFLFSLRQIPAKDYELSIYANIPLSAWIFLVIGIFGGISIVIYQAILGEENKQWLIGYFILIFIDSIIFSLFIVKNYALYNCADPLTHVGRARDIVLYGHFGKDNFYPIMHIWAASVAEITGMSATLIMKYQSLLSVLFVLFMYLLATAVFREKEKIILTSALATIPFLSSSYYTAAVPNGFSLMMLFPLVIYLYFKSKRAKNVGFTLSLVLYLILIPFSHPLTTLFSFVFLVVAELSYKMYPRLVKRKLYKYKISVTPIIFPILILSITFITWISSYAIFNKSLHAVLLWTKMELSSPVKEIGDIFQKLNLSLYERAILFLKLYSSNMLLFVLSFLAFLHIVKRFYSITDAQDDDNQNISAILLYSIFSGFLILLFLLTGDPLIQPLRSLNFVFLTTVPLAGYGLYMICTRIKSFPSKKFIVLRISIVCLLSLSFITSTFAVYDSPYTLKPTQHVTYAHLYGMRWFFVFKDPSIKGVALEASTPWRFGDAMYGMEAKEKRDDLIRWKTWAKVPDHFGYPYNKTLGQNYKEDKYLPIAKIDILSYTQVWTRVGRYNENDIKMLEIDPTVDKIYSNGNLDIRFVHPCISN